MTIIRAIDGGGAGFRRVDFVDGKIGEITSTKGPLNNLDELLSFVSQDLPPDTSGIAFAMAAILHNRDYVVVAPNVPFLNNINLAKEISKHTNLKTFVLNDMEAAVIGMAKLLPGENYFMGITWSTGVGVKVWKNGELISPLTEAAHMVYDSGEEAHVCGCGKKGHFEAYLGGRFIKEKVITKTRELNLQIPSGEPADFMNKSYVLGEEWACSLYQEIGDQMGIFLANLQSVFNLPLIVWKGTVALNMLKNIEPQIRQKMKEVIINPSWADKKYLRFIFSPKPYEDALIGAATFFESQNQK